MIRVLAGSARLEQLIRRIPSLEFAGLVDPFHFSESERPGDVVLLEIEDSADPDFSALAAVPIPVILLLDSALTGSAVRSGIRGAIPPDATAEEIEAAIHAVNAGLVVSMPETPAFAQAAAEPLTTRELEVLDLVAEGLSNKVIAHRLNISEHTVKTHVASIFAKLGASSRTEAVSRAIRRGLVML